MLRVQICRFQSPALVGILIVFLLLLRWHICVTISCASNKYSFYFFLHLFTMLLTFEMSISSRYVLSLFWMFFSISTFFSVFLVVDSFSNHEYVNCHGLCLLVLLCLHVFQSNVIFSNSTFVLFLSGSSCLYLVPTYICELKFGEV